MIKKSIFIVLAMFGFGTTAVAMDHMSSMMNGGDSNFMGAVELKYKVLGSEGDAQLSNLSYRARLGWKGDVNEAIKWGVSVSTPVDGTNFSTASLSSIHLEQAYVSYMPVEGFALLIGKYGWGSNFNKGGILYDDDLYSEGVSLKYHQGMDDTQWFIKLALKELHSDYVGGLFKTAGTLAKAKVGVSHDMDDMKAKLYVGVVHDGLFKADDHTAKTLVKAGVNVSTSSMAVPAGLYAIYGSDMDTIGDNHNFVAGVYVGSASTPVSGDMRDFGLAVSYYDIKKDSFNTALLDTDYFNSDRATLGQADVKGVAVRAQYNLWDNVNIVAKYARDMNEGVENKDNLVGELTFNF